MATAAKPQIRRDLETVELDGEAVVYDAGIQGMHHLNPAATLVFKLLDGTSTVRDLSLLIAESNELPQGEVERQVRALIREFKKNSLLEGSLDIVEKVKSAHAHGDEVDPAPLPDQHDGHDHEGHDHGAHDHEHGAEGPSGSG